MTAPEQPDWAKALNAAATEFGKGVGQMTRTLSAQGAMGWAYRGDIDGVRAVLAKMEPEQLHEVSAAAAILASLADEALKERGRG